MARLGWGEGTDEIPHVIRYAQSRDGVHWKNGITRAYRLSGSDNGAACRPMRHHVARHEDVVLLMIANIGFTTRPMEDGLTWQQLGEMRASTFRQTSWDSVMIEVITRVRHRGQLYAIQTWPRCTGSG